jgi:hypothetical protein
MNYMFSNQIANTHYNVYKFRVRVVVDTVDALTVSMLNRRVGVVHC